jgi:Trypsin
MFFHRNMTSQPRRDRAKFFAAAIAAAVAGALASACTSADDGDASDAVDGAQVEALQLAKEQFDEPGAFTVCSSTQETVTFGPPEMLGQTYTKHEGYHFEVMSRELRARPELQQATGLSVVDSCESARLVGRALNEAEPAAGPALPELTEKIANAVQPVTAHEIVAVYLYDGDGNFTGACTATAINQSTLLTAAHCISGASRYFRAWKHIAGGSSFPTIGTWTELTVGQTLASLVKNPNWNGTSDNFDDIALVLSATNLAITNAQVAFMWGEPQSLLGAGVTSPIIGWAREAGDIAAMWAGNTLPHSWTLNRIISRYVSNDINRRGRPCQGDSGGPLMHQRWANHNVIAGVLSNGTAADVGNGQKCSKDGTDNFWTATAGKIGWINQVVPRGCAFWRDVNTNRRYLDCTVASR